MIRTLSVRLAFGALVLVGLGGVPATSFSQAASPTGIAVGAMAPSATVETLDGVKLDLATLYGSRPVVLEFWATWCPLCKALEPSMQAARNTYGNRVTFVGVGVSASQTPEKQRQYVEQQKMSGRFVFDRTDAAAKAFSAPHTSYVVVIDAHGKVVYTGVGSDQQIDAAIKKALP